MSNIDTGSNAWRMPSNHNKMIDYQHNLSEEEFGGVEISYYGSSAFCVKSPNGISVMIDPWRNHPSRTFDWYFDDFPRVRVNIGVSTHAHFDHDALHRLDTDVAIERLVGNYTFSDISLQGIADKHATDCSCGFYDYNKVLKEVYAVDINPPNNPRSWDNCLIVVETGGLRILHWGDNRANPPDEVWQALGHIDIALLPIDDSRHVLGYAPVDSIIARLNPKVIIPHHYYIWDVLQRHSTLLTPEKWLEEQPSVIRLEKAFKNYRCNDLPNEGHVVHYFGENVMFDKKLWRRGEI